jgi:dihydropteroate synthase
MEKDITMEEFDNGLLKEVEESFDRLDEYIKKIRKKSQKQWIFGFVSGYGTAVAGMAIGAFFIKLINKKK